MPKILDCTIRDGGHLNKWKFTSECVRAAYNAAIRGSADYFEIGYRFPDSVSGVGDFGYCRDSFLSTLVKPSGTCKLTVMIDAGKADGVVFADRLTEKTPVQAVRVATYPDTLEKAMELSENLLGKGYEVFLNLMAYSELSADGFKRLSAWSAKDKLQAVYFADSFGSFLPEDIAGHVKTLKDAGVLNVGFHPHNNMQMAFANTLAAMSAEVSHVDASIFGMGRGSGNLPIEAILGYLEKRGNNHYNPVPYLDVAERYFLDLYKQLGWGYSIPAFLSGLKNIHPYYATELFSKKAYTVDEIWDILEDIKTKCPVSYSSGILSKALGDRFYMPADEARLQSAKSLITEQFEIMPADDYKKQESFELDNSRPDSNFLVLANGPSVKKYSPEIINFAKKNNCVIIGLNRIPDEYEADFHAFISRKRFLAGAKFVKPQSILLIPSFFGRRFVEENYSGKYCFFEVSPALSGTVLPDENGVQRPLNINVAISAILLAARMGASNVYAAGMDGYLDGSGKLVYFYNETGRPDEKEVASLRYELFKNELDRTSEYLQSLPAHFAIITPTSHKKYFMKAIKTEAA